MLMGKRNCSNETKFKVFELPKCVSVFRRKCGYQGDNIDLFRTLP